MRNKERYNEVYKTQIRRKLRGMLIQSEVLWYLQFTGTKNVIGFSYGDQGDQGGILCLSI